jgi:Ferric iron reductase FhuF-like transporter
MLLHDVGDPIACWQYAERYLGVGTRTYSRFAGDLEISPHCHPQLGNPSFTVSTFRVPPPLASWLSNGLASDLPSLYRDGEDVLLPVHPDALHFDGLVGRADLLRCGPGPDLEVVPSANARTVFVARLGGAPVPPHFLKLHYPRRLSRFTRRLRAPIIGLQLWVADELARVGVPFLPEVGGGVFGTGTDAWGFLVRETALPLPFVVPLFALYGKDYHAPDDPTLLEQLVRASGEPAEAFVAERIVAPMVRLWVRIVGSTGCAPEMHGQNTLFTFAADGRTTGVLYRDCGIYVDADTRTACGLDRSLPPTNVIPRDVPFPSAQVFSLVYDSFMGHHALSYVAGVAEERLGVDRKALYEAAREAFGSSTDLLPETVYYYDNTLYDEGGWHLVDTGQRPTWR